MDLPAHDTSAHSRQAAALAASHDLRSLRRMLRRTERRIDRAAPGQRSTVVALIYTVIGLLLPLPVAFLLPTHLSPLVSAVRVGAIPCAALGLVAIAALSSARRRLLRHYGAHQAWRVLARAIDAATAKDKKKT